MPESGRKSTGVVGLILGYTPATIVPALTTLASTFIYTRLLTTSAYGDYTFVFNAVMVLQSVVFYAPNLLVTRFYAAAEKEGTLDQFYKTMYGIMLGLVLATVLIGALITVLILETNVEVVSGTSLAIPLLILRALMVTNQTFNRVCGNHVRYVVVECLNAILGLGFGIILVYASVPGDTALLGGLILGTGICCLIDWRHLLCLKLKVGLDYDLLHRSAQYAWPLVLSFAVGCLLQYSDRFVVGSLASTSALGVYAVAFSLIDRPITMICMSITAATLPIAVTRYEHDGPDAGRRQAGHNGAIMIALALPACIGLAMTSHLIAGVLVGAAFRDGVAALIPIMAFTSLLRCVSSHYIDHNFHLSQSSRTMLYVYAPPAAANLLLSLLLVPIYGVFAAAFAALACQATAMVLAWMAAKRVLPLWLPLGEMLKVGLSTLVMAAIMAVVTVPSGIVGLLESICLGVIVYGVAAISLNLANAQRLIIQHTPWARRTLRSDS